jgi:hypothetical protein
MKKRWVAFAIIVVLLISVFGILRYISERPSPSGKYFSVVSIPQWTSGQVPTPCLSVEIGDKVIISELDLGFRGQLALSGEVLDQIEKKTYLKSKKMYGNGGKEYENKIFEIPEFWVGDLYVHRGWVQEESADFNANGTIVKDKKNPSQYESGRIGWEIFQCTNLLLDLGNKLIAYSDSLATLKKEGYAVESFTKTPLITERGLLEFDVTTSSGKLRCVLDTGCTLNVLNASQVADVPFFSSENAVTFPQFKISEREYGPIAFYRHLVEIPIHIEALLGMQFLKDHLVFIDFANQFIYFAPRKV